MKRRKRKKYVYTASMRPLSFTHEFLNSEQKWISLLQSSQRVPDRFRKHSLFGIGRDVSETWWKALGRELVAEKYLMEATGHNKFSTLCKLTPKVLTPKISHEALSKAWGGEGVGLHFQPREERRNAHWTVLSALYWRQHELCIGFIVWMHSNL